MKSRQRAVCLIMVALTLLLPFYHQAGASPHLMYVGNTSSLNLRSGPGYEFAIIGSAQRNEAVELIGFEAGYAWANVRVVQSGLYGYMDSSFLFDLPQPPPINPDYPPNAQAMVKNPSPTGFLNLRETPSYTAKVLGIYYNGTVCMVLGKTGGWYHVMMQNGLKGYFRQEFLSFDFDVLNPTPPGGAIGTAYVRSSGGRVNLRQGPGYEYPVLTSYRPGKLVTVYSKGPAFWQISVDGTMGFMDSRYLGSSGGSPPPGTGSGNATVRSGAVLNLRQQPSTTAKVLGKYRAGTSVKVLKQGLEWCYVSLPSTGATGYFMTKYLKLIGLPEVPTKIVKHPSGSYVNLRSLPNTRTGDVNMRMPHNSVVTVLIPGGDWTRVRFGTVNGYAMSSFLK